MKPFLPPERPGTANDYLYRAATAAFLARATNAYFDAVVEPGDTITPLLLKATTSPTALTGSA